MQHDGQPLAADELDHEHHRPTNVASVHTRALVTWAAIYPMAFVGMTILATWAPQWPIALRALVLTGIAVPVAVYLAVPRLLLVALAISARVRGLATTSPAPFKPVGLPGTGERP